MKGRGRSGKLCKYLQVYFEPHSSIKSIWTSVMKWLLKRRELTLGLDLESNVKALYMIQEWYLLIEIKAMDLSSFLQTTMKMKLSRFEFISSQQFRRSLINQNLKCEYK